MQKIKKYIKHNRFLFFLFWPAVCLKRSIVYIGLTIKYAYIFNFKKYMRKDGLAFFSPYLLLKKFKDIHLGDRCFIVGTGPSLNIEDLNLLCNEYTFSVNSIYKTFDKTEWRPTYYLVQDEDVYRFRETEQIASVPCKARFYGDTLIRYAGNEHQIYYPLNLLPMRDNYLNNGFSDDAYLEVVDGCSVIYSAMQIAVYMGFKQIYLLGCDCDYGQPICHFMDESNPKHPLLTPPPNMTEIMNRSYLGAKKFADKSDVNIYNSTRGGKLDLFKRISLDSVLLTECTNKKLLNKNVD
ncbi:MAG: 6-hydroxymethylpterin diphosphokinase MptE-like protein [Synergistaceae bacterium]